MSIRVRSEKPTDTRSREISVGPAVKVRLQTIILSTAQTKTLRERVEDIARKLPDGEVVAPDELARALGQDRQRVTEAVSASGFFVSVLVDPSHRARCLCNPTTARKFAA
jgi:hypothetical protein